MSVCACVTLLHAGALQVRVDSVLNGIIWLPFFLEQFIDTLDDALQGLVHVQPHFLLTAHEKRQTPQIYHRPACSSLTAERKIQLHKCPLGIQLEAQMDR